MLSILEFLERVFNFNGNNSTTMYPWNNLPDRVYKGFYVHVIVDYKVYFTIHKINYDYDPDGYEGWATILHNQPLDRSADSLQEALMKARKYIDEELS